MPNQSENDMRPWLRQVLPLHGRLSAVVAAIVESSLKNNGIEHLNVTHRTKSEESAIEKIQRKNYVDPTRQLTDLSGTRIITYLEENVTQIGELIKRLFEIDPENSHDRSTILGPDRLGYRSTHFVCVLGSRRDLLEEYKGLSELKFEIQVRTVLQHAWAEMAHDWSFKFGVELPPTVQRRLNLLSGQLESVDNSFSDIAYEIEKYKTEISQKTIIQISDAEIDSISIPKFLEQLSTRLSIEIKGEVSRAGYVELRKFGIKTIGDLEKLATPQFVDAHKKAYKEISTSVGVIRRMMMFHDLNGFISTKPLFGGIVSQTYGFLREKYSADQIETCLKQADIRIPRSR
jgi:putative GTP pyrophosphokinase